MQFITIEGFVTAFPENFKLAEKMFKWLKSQSEKNQLDFETLALSMELLTKPKSEIYMQSY